MVDLMSMAASLTRSDLPTEELRWIADEIGLEATIKLVMNMSGIAVYVPKSLKDRLKKEYAQRQYDGKNAKFLALQLDVTERTVYAWVAERAPRLQRDLFEADTDDE